MEAEQVGHCDHCKKVYELRNHHKVICSTCKATFCNSKCKKASKRDHKKCIGRPRYEPPKPEPPPLPPKPVLENERLRRLLFGDQDEFMCGYVDPQGVTQPATLPERAVEIMASCYQRRRGFYLEKVPTTAAGRAVGALRLHFMDFIELGNCLLNNDICQDVNWVLLPEHALEALKQYDLGEEYFAISLTVGPRDGPHHVDRVVRFLYKGMV
jgi:hypothetical protein